MERIESIILERLNRKWNDSCEEIEYFHWQKIVIALAVFVFAPVFFIEKTNCFRECLFRSVWIQNCQNQNYSEIARRNKEFFWQWNYPANNRNNCDEVIEKVFVFVLLANIWFSFTKIIFVFEFLKLWELFCFFLCHNSKIKGKNGIRKI